MLRELQTVKELIDALGGLQEAAKLAGTTTQAVVNWRGRERVPPMRVLQLHEELRRRGVTIAPSLWADPETNNKTTCSELDNA